jgi:hypothetical protein
LLPEGVLVDLPVRAAIKREGIGHERFGLLPDLVGLLGDESVFGRIVGFGSVRSVGADPVGKRNLAGTRGHHNRISTLLYGIAEFRAEAFVPRAPERRLIRERLEAESLSERGIRS